MLEGEICELNEYDMESFGLFEVNEKTIATLEDEWWPQAATWKWDNIFGKEKRDER